jgi:hypothetical protein
MAIDITSIAAYTDAQILTVLRASLINAAIAQEYSIGGRSVARMNGKEIQDLINVYEARVNLKDGNGIGFGSAIVQFNQPT